MARALLLLLSLAVPPSTGQEVPPVQGRPVLELLLEKKIDVLRPRLGDPDWEAREEAGAELSRLIEKSDEDAARAVLRAFLDSEEDPEILGRLRLAYDALPIFEARFLAPKEFNRSKDLEYWVEIRNLSHEERWYREHWGPYFVDMRLVTSGHHETLLLPFLPLEEPGPEARSIKPGESVRFMKKACWVYLQGMQDGGRVELNLGLRDPMDEQDLRSYLWEEGAFRRRVQTARGEEIVATKLRLKAPARVLISDGPKESY